MMRLGIKIKQICFIILTPFTIFVFMNQIPFIMKKIYLAGGCFWGTQHFMKQINGVVATRTGYANGNTESPTYEEVYTDSTGYAETVEVVYDSSVIDLHKILHLYFCSIDPTSLNKQGADIGTRYRTGIYYTDISDLDIIEQVYNEIASHYDVPLCVEIEPLHTFYVAELYHQDYLDKYPGGYCHISRELIEMARNA